MINTPTPSNVAEYLRELEAALSDAPTDVRNDILAGVEEELIGLDAPTAAARIAELGDPVFIAAEATAAARAESTGPAAPASSSAASTGESPTTNPGWYSVLTVVLLVVGGYVFPVIGWMVGAVMLIASRSWSGWDKLIGLLVPAVTLAIALPIFLALRGETTGVPALVICGGVTFIVGLLSGIRLLRRARA